jgi:O-antigen/teichoic acid export membrane protein
VSGAERPALLSHLRKLLSHSAVYGLADVFPSLLGLLLAPVFTRLMTPADYGALALLALFSSVAKIVFRLGLDGAFFRLHYDQPDEPARRRLAGTAALLAALVGTALFGLVALGAGPLTGALFEDGAPRRWLLLAAADIFVAAQSFVPQGLLRIQDRARLFSALAIARQTFNIALKLLLLWLGHGVTGVLISDVVASALFTFALLPVLWRHAEWRLDARLAGELLGLGLPRVPHGFLLQVQNLFDRRILDAFVSLAEVGLYGVGYTFGSAVKFALSAFEPAWQPFVYAQIRRPEAQQTLARLVTYVLAGFTFCALGVALLGPELVRGLLAPPFHGAAPVVPVVAAAYLLHGVFLLTSIGINVQKRPGLYPVITLASAGTNVAANLVLIPRLGMMGAAWATLVSYALMAALGVVLSQRLYPLPFEKGRLARLALAAGVAYAPAAWAPAALAPALALKLALLLAFLALVCASVATPEERRWLAARGRRPS